MLCQSRQLAFHSLWKKNDRVASSGTSIHSFQYRKETQEVLLPSNKSAKKEAPKEE